MTSRAIQGGLERRYTVTRADGSPCRPSDRFPVILNLGSDPHAGPTLLFYADRIEADNPQLSADIRAAVADPQNTQAQHDNAG